MCSSPKPKSQVSSKSRTAPQWDAQLMQRFAAVGNAAEQRREARRKARGEPAPVEVSGASPVEEPVMFLSRRWWRWLLDI